jgi:GMP synthase-like glutamine amidotransferase
MMVPRFTLVEITKDETWDDLFERMEDVIQAWMSHGDTFVAFQIFREDDGSTLAILQFSGRPDPR